MEQTIAPKEVRILETAEDIQERRDQVLSRYSQFKSDARAKRDKLEDSRRFQYFKRDADELESWIFEKLQAASDESYRDPTNLQAKIQKHQAFEAEVAAHSNAIVSLDNIGLEMINEGHFAADVIQKRLEELHRLWELLLSRLADKGMKLQQALVLVQFLRQCDEVMFWINDKVLLLQFLAYSSAPLKFVVEYRKLSFPLMNLAPIWSTWKYCNVNLTNSRKIWQPKNSESLRSWTLLIVSLKTVILKSIPLTVVKR